MIIIICLIIAFILVLRFIPLNKLTLSRTLKNHSTILQPVELSPIYTTSDGNQYRIYSGENFLIHYPGNLQPFEEICNPPKCFYKKKNVSFVDARFSPENGNNHVNTIEVYPDKDISKLSSLEIVNKYLTNINGRQFIAGDDPKDSAWKVFWFQGEGFALKITFSPRPKESPLYFNNYIDLASIKLK